MVETDISFILATNKIEIINTLGTIKQERDREREKKNEEQKCNLRSILHRFRGSIGLVLR